MQFLKLSSLFIVIMLLFLCKRKRQQKQVSNFDAFKNYVYRMGCMPVVIDCSYYFRSLNMYKWIQIWDSKSLICDRRKFEHAAGNRFD